MRSKKRRSDERMISISESVDTTVNVDVDVHVSDLSDDDLRACIEEARERGLIGGICRTESRREQFVAVIEDLLARRTTKALQRFEDALFLGDESGLSDCWRALRDGNWSLAICILDGVVYPTPAREATEASLKKMFQREPISAES